ncbi:hypothetical protein IFM89_036684 [Coptis chinensis]|uniref:Uncharacterized protein n=1 Tax=Coptis chinensis TaxID=261450 RepID=A0A835I6Z6_9MAGN|nr:hypothetical protein IFM89_036684 [Coptis chinensis]
MELKLRCDHNMGVSSGRLGVRLCSEFVRMPRKATPLLLRRQNGWRRKSECTNLFATKEAGRMVLAIDNTNSRQRMVLCHRYIVRRPLR